MMHDRPRPSVVAFDVVGTLFFHPAMGEPSVRGDSLPDVVDGLLALKG